MNIEDVIELNVPVDKQALKDVKFSWHRYHAEKDIERYACSITSFDGTDSPGLNFEALQAYNRAHNTSLNEMMFQEPTKHSTPYKYLLHHFDVGRSHYLRLMRAGYFPWHRDADPTSLRLIHTIENCTAESLVWVLDNKVIRLDNDRWYLINTLKKHCLFAFDDVTFAVFNVANTQENMIELYKHMVIK